jgi:ABC-type polysaccharide/polyol phosphate export permease
MTRRQRLETIRELAVCDFRLKYHDSVVGYVWSMLSPILMLAVFYLVFRFLIVVSTRDYLVYLSIGLVSWTFFQDCSFSGLTSLTAKADLVKAVRAPVGLVVIAAALSTVITLAINTAVLALALAVSGHLSPRAPLAIVPLGCLVLLATGLSCLVALAHAHFRDTALMWTVLLQAGFWLTPVVYHVQSPAIAELMDLNPLARCLSLLRGFLVDGHPPAVRFVLGTVLACGSVFTLGFGLLRRQQARVPELL